MKTQEELDKELQSIKAKYKKTYTLTIPLEDSEEVATIYLRDIDETVYRNALDIYTQNEIESMRFVINNLYIGGDDKSIVVEDFRNIVKAKRVLINLFDFGGAELKKN